MDLTWRHLVLAAEEIVARMQTNLFFFIIEKTGTLSWRIFVPAGLFVPFCLKKKEATDGLPLKIVTSKPVVGTYGQVRGVTMDLTFEVVADQTVTQGNI